MDVVQGLSGVPFLVGLTPTALTELAAYTRIVSFAAGDTIVELETGSPLFVVLDGHVRIVEPESGTDLAPIVLGPGECFGDTAVLNGEPREARIEATEETRVLMLEQQVFLANWSPGCPPLGFRSSRTCLSGSGAPRNSSGI